MLPFNYEELNMYSGSRQTTGKDQRDMTTAYFTRCLYQRAIGSVTFTIPKDWNYQYFVNVLFREGFLAVIPSGTYGVIPQICTLSGYGIFRQPVRALVSQPLVRYEGTIGEDCELIKLTPDYRGIWDIIDHYAELLATAMTSVDMALHNSRLAALLAAKDKASAATLKLIAEKIDAGEPVIVVDSKLKENELDQDPIWTFAYNVKDNYIVDKLLQDMRTIMEDFDREIGIPIVNDKKERMLTDEVNAILSDSVPRLTTWKNCLQESIDAVNRMFPDLDITFKTVRDELEEKEVEADDREDNTDRNV